MEDSRRIESSDPLRLDYITREKGSEAGTEVPPTRPPYLRTPDVLRYLFLFLRPALLTEE